MTAKLLMSLQPLLGVVLITALAWASSRARQPLPWKLILGCLALQLLLALAFLKLPPLQELLLWINRGVLAIEAATREGTTLVFGYLGGGTEPFEATAPEHSFVLAFRSLPLVIVFAALSALLWHWRVIPLIVGAMARLLQKSLGLSGALSVGAASSVFVGMVESPLLIKHYLQKMSRSELFVLMSCGMATVAGTVMGLYAGILAPVLPQALSHILVASLVSAPAAVMLGRIIVPEDQAPAEGEISMESPYSGSMDALVSGTGEGVRLLGNIIAMLIVFVALVYLVDAALGLIPTGGEPLSLIGLTGTLLSPLAFALGIPWQEAQFAGELLATKVFVNELVAYLQLSSAPPAALGQRSEIILTYALCGFANFGSLGIMIGGLTTLCPERRADILALSPLAVWSGFLATCLTGAVVALVY